MRGGGEEGVREKFKALAKIPTAVKNRALACTVPSKPEEGALRFSDGTDICVIVGADNCLHTAIGRLNH